MTPTSERQAPRVYPETVKPVPPPQPVAPPPAGVSANDIAIGQSINRLLKDDSGLAGVSGNVEATIDNGVVTLRGRVPSEHDRTEIADRIARLPGVAKVHDQLEVRQW
jgi:osmotically-inducible protein OsmY